MKIEDLGKKLRADYDRAASREKVFSIYLFGIRYADQTGSAANQVAVAAGISPKYGTELRKAMKLSKYVTLKNESAA